MPTKPLHLVLGTLLLLSCDSAEPGDAEPGDADPVAAAEAPPTQLAAPAPSEDARREHAEKKEEWEVRHAAPNGRAMFDEVVELIEKDYVDGPLSEDELWTAAAEGVLERLIQLRDHRVNKLLSPEELAELEVGTRGALVGVGVMIERVADVVVINGIIAGGPAEDAGLQEGDRILGVDGERVRDLTLAEVVGKIRGELGSKVDLFVQRDTEEWTETVTRGEVKVPSVEARLLEGGVGVVRITNFSNTTVPELQSHLAALRDEGMKGLVIDLRHCPGGLLEAALEAADEFLAPGARIVSVRSRGGEEKHFDAQRETQWQTLPIAMVIGSDTASGAEILASALAENGRATLIGDQTQGKGTVESIHELRNGWALKLSVSRFYSPEGHNRQNVGVRPDIVVPGTPDASWAPLPRLEVDTDPQLATAVDLMAERVGG
jgi:carboxyl-terminal processing protease